MKITDISDLTKEGLLAAAGLATKPTATNRLLSAFGFFAIGVVVGAATALLFAPKSGPGLREDIGDRLRHVGKEELTTSNASSSSDEARA
jgi:gas vesicle protein